MRQGRVMTSPLKALFPRYLYIELNFQTDNCASIRSIRGVSSLVRFRDYVAVIPTHFIDAFKQRESEGRF